MASDRLGGKVAVITGATSGIGRRTAERFVEEGASVVFSGRRRELGEAVAADLGERACFVQADVEAPADFARLVDTAVARFGRLDVLFNNAGGPAPAGPVAEVEIEAFDQAVRVLFRSVFLGARAVAPTMAAQGSGVIISNASVAAHLGGYATSHIYTACKAAVVSFTQSIALELAESGVRANTVSPGAIATGIFGRGAGLEGDQADESAERVAKALTKAQPLARAGLPDDVASAVVFLASDEASFITGRDLVIDGGLIAGRRFSDVQASRDAMRKLVTPRAPAAG